MIVHAIFRCGRRLCAWAMAVFVTRAGYLDGVRRTPFRDPGYFIALGIGAIAGALLFGSTNMGLAGFWQIGHSIAGAIAGGIIAVEIYKMVHRHQRLDRVPVRGAARAWASPSAAWAASSPGCPTSPTARRPPALGRGFRRRHSRAIRCSFTNRRRWSLFLVVYSGRHRARLGAFSATGLLSFRGLVCAAAFRLGIPQALSDRDRAAQCLSLRLHRLVRLQRFS